MLDIKIVVKCLNRQNPEDLHQTMDQLYQLQLDQYDLADNSNDLINQHKLQSYSQQPWQFEQDSLLLHKVDQQPSEVASEVKHIESGQQSHSNHLKKTQFQPDSQENQSVIGKPIKKLSSLKSEDSLKGSTTTARTHHSINSNASTNNSKKKNRSKKKSFRILNQEECTLAEYLFRAGHNLKLVSSKLKISQQTSKKLQAQFELYGKIVPTEGAINAIKMAKQRQSEHQTVLDTIKDLLSKDCSITLKGMQKVLKQQGIYRSLSSIYSYLEKMKYTRKKLQKVPLQRNSLNMLKYRQNYCKMIQQIPLQKQVFMDETIFGLQTSGHYGWALKGQQPKVFVPANKKKHVTLLAAISIRGFEATRLIKGPVTSKHICQFIEHYLDHLQPDQVLILDNARMHHAAIVKEKIKAINRNVRYLPAYTPQLNPIENVFSEIKVQYVRLKQDNDLKVQDMIRVIEQAIKSMRSKTFSRYYEHYQQWLKKGVAGQLFG